MLKIKDKNVKMYRGGYRPVKAVKNLKNIGGYSRQAISSEQEVYTGTYDDSLDLFGKSGYKPGYNLCPPLDFYEYYYSDTNGEKRGVKIMPNRDGTFNFVGDTYYMCGVANVELPPGTYTASGSAIIRVAMDIEFSNYIELPYTFTTTETITVQVTLFYPYDEYSEWENQYIQIEVGETATEYRPYCGELSSSVSTAHPKVIVGSKADIKTWCKNLLDITEIRGTTCTTETASLYCRPDGGITGSGTSGDAISFYPFKNLNLPTGEYVFSAKGNATGISCTLYIRDENEQDLDIINLTSTSSPVVIDLSSYSDYHHITYRIFAISNTEISGTAYFQLEKGSEPTEYEVSYGRSDVSCPELFSVEVTADDPYNYTETVDGTKKYYICDTLKGNKLTRRIGKITFDGTEDGWNIGTCNNSRYIVFERKKDDARGNYNVNSSHFVQTSDIATKKGYYIENSPNDEYNMKFIYSRFGAGTIEKWKDWLKNQYSKGMPVTVYYVLTEPTTEILPESLKTYPNTTYISIEKAEDSTDYGMATSIKINN